MQEFHCKIYQDYTISIPTHIRQILSILPNDEIIITVNNENQIIIETVKSKLQHIQHDIKKFFHNKSIVDDFIKNKHKDFDDEQ